MCDYSLYSINNRLACESDDLVLHRFDTGSIGFCAVAELRQEMSRGSLPQAWSSFIRWMFPRSKSRLTSVCIPPGARLFISEVPRIADPVFRALELQTVEFTQLSDRTFTYRDALLLPDGDAILLQRLPVGLRAVVLSMSFEEEKIEIPTSQPVAQRI